MAESQTEERLWKVLAGVLSICVMVVTGFVAHIAGIANETQSGIQNLEIRMERVFTTLESANPGSLRDELRDLAQSMHTDSPWVRDRVEWSRWRAGVDIRLDHLEKR